MSRHDDRSDALGLVPVSRETLERLDVYLALLAKWRKAVNLVSETSFTQIWTRHVADSAQLLAFAPDARIWVDMGSGAGFPGMVIAIQLADKTGARVHLIESDQRKCGFLREVARATGAAAQIHNGRIENAASEIPIPVDAVTARALAPLPRLIDFANIWLDAGAIGVFPRGKAASAKVERVSLYPNYSIDFSTSRIEATSEIAIIRKRDEFAPLGKTSSAFPDLAES